MTRNLALALGLAGSFLVSACSNPSELSTRGAVEPPQVSTSNFNGASVNETRFNAYITGYSYWDNTPRGSTAIARPVIHKNAGGTGTYQDPVTIAVGHKIVGRRQTLDYPAGTRFYLTNLRKYVIVEDVCGDGFRPQNGPCHSGYNGHPWLDVYIDGQRSSQTEATQCAYHITGIQPIIMNPREGYPVDRGPITESGCKSFRT